MELSIKLQAFEGPLDLLLHLIDINKMNIFDIPIIEITEQYMEYIAGIHTKDMEVMSSFLVMASTLLRIKSQLLLPQEEKDDGGEEEDPRAELVERLLEYKLYRYASYELKDRQVDAERMLFKENTVPKSIVEMKEEVVIEELLDGLSLNQLHSIFQSVMQKQEDKIDVVRSRFGKIEKEEVSLAKKFMEIQEYGLKYRHFSFRYFLMQQKGKMDVIVSFLCILELIKIGSIAVMQNGLHEDIEINYLADEAASGSGMFDE